MNNNYCQRVLPLRLPMAMAKQLHSWLNFDASFFGRWQGNSAGKKKAGEGLGVPTAKEPVGDEIGFGLRIPHPSILNGKKTGVQDDADF